MSSASLLDQCFMGFDATCYVPRYKVEQVLCASTSRRFEDRAFAALFQHREALGIATLWRCSGYRVDGYAELTTGETVLLEMKESLSWGSTTAMGFQLLAGRKLLQKPEVQRGLIVFERMAKSWTNCSRGAWQQFAMEVDNVRECMQMGALQVRADGSLCLGGHALPSAV